MWKRFLRWLYSDDVRTPEHIDITKMLGYTHPVTIAQIQENTRYAFINLRITIRDKQQAEHGLHSLTQLISTAMVGWEESILELESAIREDRDSDWRELRKTHTKKVLRQLNESYFYIRKVDTLFDVVKPITGTQAWEHWCTLLAIWKQICAFQKENHMFLDWFYAELNVERFVYTMNVIVTDAKTEKESLPCT